MTADGGPGRAAATPPPLPLDEVLAARTVAAIPWQQDAPGRAHRQRRTRPRMPAAGRRVRSPRSPVLDTAADLVSTAALPRGAGAPPRPARARARRGEGERLRSEILDAAERLLIEGGSADAVSIRAIGDAVGVTAPSIYRHFADKDALLLAACERAYDRFDDYIEAAAAQADDPLADVHARGRAYVRFALENPGQYRILFMTPNTHVHADAASHSFDPQRSEMRGFVHLVEAIERGITAGLIAPPASVLEVAALLWSLVHGIASLRIAHPEMPWPDADAAVDLLFRTLAFGMCPEAVRAVKGPVH